jgi:hypothetical protein
MRQIVMALWLACAAATVGASPVVFDQTLYTVSAFADVDGTSDGPNDAFEPSDGLPLVVEAQVSVDDAGSAVATAGADALELGARSVASSLGGTALAGAAATFFGEFTTTAGDLSLQVDLSADHSATGMFGAYADVLLGVILSVDGVPLVDELFVASSVLDWQFAVGGGLSGTLEITLVTSALAPDPLDEAESLASVRFGLEAIAATPVPAPGGLPLAGLALGLLAVCRSRFLLIGRAQDGQKT